MKKKWLVIKYLITSGVVLSLSFLVMWAFGLFSFETTKDLYQIVSDGFFVGGALVFCSGLLVFIGSFGTFDMLGYGVRSLFVVLKKDISERKYKDFYEYRVDKNSHRMKYSHLLVCGGVAIVIALIFAILVSI